MAPWVELTIKLLFLGGMMIGLFGLIVPVFPGITVIWALTLLYGISFGFGTLGGWLFGVISVLTVLGWVSDNILMNGKARQEGASWLSLFVALVAGFIGSFLVTPLGGIAIALGALYLAEYAAHKDHAAALAVTKGMAIGWGWSFVARFGIGLLMIALWAVWAWA